jgi:hypothetical protein
MSMKNKGITKSGNKWRCITGRNEYGGMTYAIDFDNPCTREDCNDVAYTLEPPVPFGYRLDRNTKIGQKTVWIKIHND